MVETKNSSLLSSLMVKAHVSFMEEALIPNRKKKTPSTDKKSSYSTRPHASEVELLEQFAKEKSEMSSIV